ncbi:MAG: glycosyltransferase family 2 protein [Hyphomicrobium sp.]|nr:glycosyltransferase family 2 protein [Hyphomicrobium sp.]
MRLGRRIGVITPALNEEDAIARVIADIPAWVDHIVVVDNGSVDDTADNAAEAGATVLMEHERGYGAACLRGMKHLDDVDILVFVDGDYSDDPSQMAELVDPILSGHADLVIGSRVLGNPEKGALLPQQIAGNWLACYLMRRLFNARYTDLGPFRAIRASSLSKLDMQDRNFGWTVEMQVKAVLRGLSVTEVPVSYRRRIGRSKISGTITGSMKAGYTILRVIAGSVLATVPRHGDVGFQPPK